MPKYRIFIARFPGEFHENPDCTNWLVNTIVQAKQDPRIEKVMSWYRSDTPITMTRNMAIEVAREVKADFVVMVDSDMKPDDLLGVDDPFACGDREFAGADVFAELRGGGIGYGVGDDGSAGGFVGRLAR